MPAPLPDDRPVRFGVLATGAISATLTAEIAATPGCEVVAVGSRTAASAQRFAGDHGIARAHASYADLIEDDGVDVVYIGATHDAHRSAAALALEAGRPVLCEKPLTVDATQAQGLVALARERGVFLMEAMWTRCQPAFLRAMELLRDGAVGQVRQVRASMGFPLPSDPSHRLLDPQRAGGVLLDMGVYPVTAAFCALGEPDAVEGTAHLRDGVDVSTVLALGWASGATAALTATVEAAADVSAVFSGSEGRIEIPPSWHRCSGFDLVRLQDGGERRDRVERPLPGRGYGPMVAEVARCLRAGETESPLVPLDDTLAVMRTLDRAAAAIGLSYPEGVYR